MQKSEVSAMQMLDALRAFLHAHASKLAGIIGNGAMRRLEDSMAEVVAQADVQQAAQAGARGCTKQYLALRATLIRDYMAPVVAIARAARSSKGASIRMPNAGKNTMELLGEAYAMAAFIAECPAVFASYSLPEDLPKRFVAAADAMVEEVDRRSAFRREQAAATRGIKANLRTARRIAGVLDAFVMAALQDNPALLAEWKALRRASSREPS